MSDHKFQGAYLGAVKITIELPGGEVKSVFYTEMNSREGRYAMKRLADFAYLNGYALKGTPIPSVKNSVMAEIRGEMEKHQARNSFGERDKQHQQRMSNLFAQVLEEAHNKEESWWEVKPGTSLEEIYSNLLGTNGTHVQKRSALAADSRG